MNKGQAMLDFPIYILRHGQTEWNVQGRMQGGLDSPLTALGRAQAQAQGRLMQPILACHPGIKAYASPLKRAHDTALLALGDYPLTLDARLREISVGAWEGQLRLDAIASTPAAAGLRADETGSYDLFCLAPDGEGEVAAKSRLEDFLAELTGPTVIVSHGIITAMLRGHLCGLDRAQTAALPHTQGAVFQILKGQETIFTESEKT